MAKDYYAILGVGQDASSEEIKSAYRKLALQNHPDRNPDDRAGAEERFKQINEAYAVLSDPDKRRNYDRFGQAEPGPFAGGAGGNPFGDIFSEFFGDFFGAGNPRGRPGERRGEDLEARVEVDLETTYRGGPVEISYNREVLCQTCSGQGGTRETCPSCGGTGQVQALRQSLLGTVAVRSPCTYCSGRGYVFKERCPDCNGRGNIRHKERIEVQLPAGIQADQMIRVAGAGNQALGGAGDLYVRIEIRPHPHFERSGDDLIYHLRLGIAQASLGANLEIPTFDEPEPLRIPAGTNHGQVFTLKGLGFPNTGGGSRGNLKVVAEIVVPDSLSPRAKELLQAYAEEVGEEIHPGEEGIWDRLKKAFKG